MSEALNRQYFELLGWKLGRHYSNERRDSVWDVWHRPDCNEATAHTVHFGISAEGGCQTNLPSLHLNANACIAELDRVFGPDWLTVAIQESYLVAQYTWHDSVTLVIRNVHRGATFNEAALKALIAAHKRDGGEK